MKLSSKILGIFQVAPIFHPLLTFNSLSGLQQPQWLPASPVSQHSFQKLCFPLKGNHLLREGQNPVCSAWGLRRHRDQALSTPAKVITGSGAEWAFGESQWGGGWPQVPEAGGRGDGVPKRRHGWGAKVLNRLPGFESWLCLFQTGDLGQWP